MLNWHFVEVINRNMKKRREEKRKERLPRSHGTCLRLSFYTFIARQCRLVAFLLFLGRFGKRRSGCYATSATQAVAVIGLRLGTSKIRMGSGIRRGIEGARRSRGQDGDWG